MLLTVRQLLLGPRRYTDILANLPGISTNFLVERCKCLEGVIHELDAGD